MKFYELVWGSTVDIYLFTYLMTTTSTTHNIITFSLSFFKWVGVGGVGGRVVSGRTVLVDKGGKNEGVRLDGCNSYLLYLLCSKNEINGLHVYWCPNNKSIHVTCIGALTYMYWCSYVYWKTCACTCYHLLYVLVLSELTYKYGKLIYIELLFDSSVLCGSQQLQRKH